MIRAHLQWGIACVRWLAKSVGYAIRPYDMLADARRWRWQAAVRCGMAPTLLAAMIDGGQWVARSKCGGIIATSPTARGIVAELNRLGPRAVGATARFEAGAS